MAAVEVPARIADLLEKRQSARKDEERARDALSDAIHRLEEVDDELWDARSAAGLCPEDHPHGEEPLAEGSSRCAGCQRRARMGQMWR